MVYNLKMMDIVILSFFLLLFCCFVWVEYLRFKSQRRQLDQAKAHGLKAIEDYQKSNHGDVAMVEKEMVQRMKARELKSAIKDAEQESTDTHQNDA